MPKREDIKTILLIGSGPIIIGQACEFDYSGTQAAKTLKELGYRVVLINSNPATIMTDPDFADATYIEPITKESISRIIKKENVDALLPTMGGQVALNVAMELYENNMLGNVKFLGANPEAIKKGEDRVAFKEAMIKIGMDLPKSMYAYNMEDVTSIRFRKRPHIFPYYIPMLQLRQEGPSAMQRERHGLHSPGTISLPGRF